MSNKKLTLRTLTIALSLASLGMASQASAVELGYVEAAGENIWKTSYGECWRSADGKHAKVEACGDVIDVAPKDSDGDGVMDDQDKCPNTTAGAKVDSTGCEIIANVTIDSTQGNFDFDSSTLKSDMKSSLSDVAAKVKATNGTESLLIIGHTDSTGSASYNQRLSEERAASVAAFLASEGIDAAAMSTEGRGESSPVASNDSSEGRSQNRRVEITTK